MKRISCTIITATYRALFEDFVRWGFGTTDESDRDLSRIALLVDTRGERIVTIDFPRMAKSFDKAISRGFIDKGAFKLLGCSSGLPPFMRSTFEMVFDQDGRLLDEANAGAVKNIRQCLRLFQKVVIPCGDNYIKETTNAFFSTDAALRRVSDSWYAGDFTTHQCALDDVLCDPDPDFWGREGAAPPSLLRLAQRVADEVVKRFPYFNPDAIIGKHGPGAVADLRKGSDKYTFPTWSAGLEGVFPRDLHASANVRLYDYEQAQSARSLWGSQELPAKLIAVPKAQDKPRLIASEPVSNQFIQGGINKFLRECVATSILGRSIDFIDQSVSRDGAMAASSDPRISTVDLKDASDRLSCWTVERIFRRAPGLLAALAASRSKYIVDGTYGNGYALMRKYAPMGNATVFPLQSMAYALLAIAAVIWLTPSGREACWTVVDGVRTVDHGSGGRKSFWSQLVAASRRVRVFGDDLIVPTDSLPALSSLLEHCQLKVNGGKSHFDGNFAESCGCDAFRGTDVTPIYVRHVLDTDTPQAIASLTEVCNNFWRDGLLGTSTYLESWIPAHFRGLIPISRSALDHDANRVEKHLRSGDKLRNLPLSLGTFIRGTAAAAVCWSSSWQCRGILGLELASEPEHVSRDGWESLLQFFVELPPDGSVRDRSWMMPSSFSDWKSGWVKESLLRLRRVWVPI